MTAALGEVVASNPRAKNWAVVFEYELPRERGRRPDVVILTGSQVIVLEFKESGRCSAARPRGPGGRLRARPAPLPRGFARQAGRPGAGADRRGGRRGVNRRRGRGGQSRGVSKEAMVTLERRAPDEPSRRGGLDGRRLFPLPSLVSAARRIFEHEPLPADQEGAERRHPRHHRHAGRGGEPGAQRAGAASGADHRSPGVGQDPGGAAVRLREPLRRHGKQAYGRLSVWQRAAGGGAAVRAQEQGVRPGRPRLPQAVRRDQRRTPRSTSGSTTRPSGPGTPSASTRSAGTTAPSRRTSSHRVAQAAPGR